MYLTDKELQKLIKRIGYKGCKNCKHQISPLRMCRWAEQGGDGQIHFLCPKWDKAESEGEMTRFSVFTDEELDMMEEAFCNEGLIYIVEEIRRERRIRESKKRME